MLMVVSVLVAMAGIVLAWFMYVRRTDLPALAGAKVARSTTWSTTSSTLDELRGHCGAPHRRRVALGVA